MTRETRSFKVGIDFESVLRAISKQIYETPLAFIRENVQNAVDAVRIQAHRDGSDPGDEQYKINVSVDGNIIVVRDNGTGMSAVDLQEFFWTIGASGKRTPEALAAGCVGMFGIGGFANFGVCDSLEVISQTSGPSDGTLTRLSEEDIQAAGAAIPSVTVEVSDSAAPRGTIVTGTLRNAANVDELRGYLQDFVRFVPTPIFFNGKRISQSKFSAIDDRDNLTEITTGQQEWQDGDMTIIGRLYEDRGNNLVAAIDGLAIAGESIALTGHIRFENGALDVFKRGFKLCATQVGTTIGTTGRLDCDRFIPTAGRDSLDPVTTSLLNRIVLALEHVAIETVLESPERIAEHTRIFRYVINRDLIGKLGQVRVRLADGSETSLGDIRRKAERGGVTVFFGLAQKQALNQIMQARGHLVIILSADRSRQQAERAYLEQYCSAKPFDGIIDCADHYHDLTRFELVFMSELETNIQKAYEVRNFRLIPGRLTEDIPVFVKEHGSNAALDVFVDVRHQEITKLEHLGFSQILYSLIATFCREYLGPTLKKWSPRFFGDGALNLDSLAKRRSELWILLKDDIGVVRKGGIRQVVTPSDVQVIRVGGTHDQVESKVIRLKPRILRIMDESGTMGLDGYYIRLPDTAFTAYGDLIPECESRGVVWAGNRILYVASDTVSTAFQYEIRLDEVVAATINGAKRAEGAIQLNRPLQELYGGLYFPIPQPLEQFLVPHGEAEIRLDLNCDWMDFRGARNWVPKEGMAG